MIKKNNQGDILVQVIVFSSIAVVMIGSLVGWAGVNIKASRESLNRERAIQLAEAGVDYYRWHLAHASTDYTDGTGTPGPYVHTVKDKNGDVVGQFSLVVTPPSIGSTKVKIESTGTPSSTSLASRKIAVELAIPSLAKYAVVANDNMRFGQGTEVFGPILSNGGIRFDGLAHNIISSALNSYDEPDHTGGQEYGVHTHVLSNGSVSDTFRSAEAPPSSIPDRSDIFETGRQFPVPTVDFVGLTTNLASIKTDAQSAGKYFAASGAQGYQIILKTNDTFDVYRVTSLESPSNKCTSGGLTGWGTWSIKNKTFLANYPIPTNGLVFAEDNVWVEGMINTARVTIASGKFPDNPSTRPDIIINNDLLYTNYDGRDVIALISQDNITVGMISDTDLRIDAALVAQNGRVGRYYYPGPGNNTCAPYHTRNSITLYGMIATNLRYGFAYGDGNGYDIRNINYDANLLYSPPPSFPLTSSQYEILSWEEVR